MTLYGEITFVLLIVTVTTLILLNKKYKNISKLNVAASMALSFLQPIGLFYLIYLLNKKTRKITT